MISAQSFTGHDSIELISKEAYLGAYAHSIIDAVLAFLAYMAYMPAGSALMS